MCSYSKVFLKVVILGDSGVGKTSLMNQYVNKKFANCYKATIGADFMTKDLDINGKGVTLQIWDTAGLERFQSLGVAFYRGADCCILVYDVTDSNSFRSLDSWQEEFIVQSASKEIADFPFIVVGNKADMEGRTVSAKSLEQWCSSHESALCCFEASAKESFNVDQVFRKAAELALKKCSQQREFPNFPNHANFVDLSSLSNDQLSRCSC